VRGKPENFNRPDYNFRLVLPQVPKEVAGNIYVFLGEINARKRFTYSLSLGGGPDTNINAAPSISQLTLFGLPFTLPQGSRETFGVGVVMSDTRSDITLFEYAGDAHVSDSEDSNTR